MISPHPYTPPKGYEPPRRRIIFKRYGACNLCGECCGYPRSTDGGQNNPWPADWPSGIITWTDTDRNERYPVFQLVDHRKTHGVIRVDDEILHWIWVPGHGLCKDLKPYGDPSTYDQRCPFLSKRRLDGTCPCLLKDTASTTWSRHCNLVPPLTMDSQEEVDQWNKSCPSCSFEYFPEEVEWLPL